MIALIPAVVVSVVFYGLAELLVLAVSVISCVALEYLITKYLLKAPSTVGDWSAAVTGILLALNASRHDTLVGCVHRRCRRHRNRKDDLLAVSDRMSSTRLLSAVCSC